MSHEPRAASGEPSGPGAAGEPLTPAQWLERLVGELDRWGALFLQLARDNRAPAAEQVLGGLVDWMGNGLMDGWLHLPIPVFEALSDLAEELLQAFQAYLAWLRADGAKAGDARKGHENAIRAIVARARALALPDSSQTAQSHHQGTKAQRESQ